MLRAFFATWICRRCSTRNVVGHDKHCTKCGSPDLHPV